MDRGGKGSRGQNNFALSANLSRNRARLSFSVHLPPPPPLPYSFFLRVYFFSSFFPSYLRPRLRSLLNKRPPAMFQDSDVRLRPFSFSIYSSRVSCISCRVPNHRSEFFSSPFPFPLFSVYARYRWMNACITS